MTAFLVSLILLGNPVQDPTAEEASAPASSQPQTQTTPLETSAEPDSRAAAEAARRQAENEAVIRIAEETEQAERAASSQESPSESEESLPTLTGALLQMFIVLAAVCLLAYLLLGRVLPRLMRVQMPTASQRILRIVDRVAIDQRGAILIVSVGDHYFLVGVSPGGIDLISRLESDVVLAALEDPPVGHTPKLSRWAEALLAKRQKES